MNGICSPAPCFTYIMDNVADNIVIIGFVVGVNYASPAIRVSTTKHWTSYIMNSITNDLDI